MTRGARLGMQLPLFCLSLVAIDASAQEVRTWLDRMNRAVEALNYEGTFVHVIGRSAETMQVVHRNDGGRVTERITSLDGNRSELVRRQNHVQCILPGRRVVLLEQTRETSPLVAALPIYSEDLEANYKLVSYQKGQVVERPTQVLGIKAKDQMRYSYVLWLDQESALPLKTQVRDENGEVVEQILFTDLSVQDQIPAQAVASTLDTEGFTWFRPPSPDHEPGGDVAWRASALPPGFKLSAAMVSSMGGSDIPVDHLVYSDGLATVSVFIEGPKTNSDVKEGFFRLGSTNAYSLVLPSGHHATAIGEVPRETVQVIAASLESR